MLSLLNFSRACAAENHFNDVKISSLLLRVWKKHPSFAPSGLGPCAKLVWLEGHIHPVLFPSGRKDYSFQVRPPTLKYDWKHRASGLRTQHWFSLALTKSPRDGLKSFNSKCTEIEMKIEAFGWRNVDEAWGINNSVRAEQLYVT